MERRTVVRVWETLPHTRETTEGGSQSSVHPNLTIATMETVTDPRSCQGGELRPRLSFVQRFEH